MSDLKKYITKRKKDNKEFAENYDIGYQNFKVGVLLKQLRHESNFEKSDENSKSFIIEK